jgi:CBS domain-containing protein/gamma-glutamyl:cysteine ligase YbdK (ATP-grasp superfamily)
VGDKEVHLAIDEEELRVFTHALLRDVRALEDMHDTDLFETGVRRIGLEQEMFLVDSEFRAAPIAVEVLEAVQDDRITSEIGRFNLEGNLLPLVFSGDALSRMEDTLRSMLESVQELVRSMDGDIVLTGILPTLRKSDLHLDNMVPEERYYALNDALTRLRGGPYELRIKGTDDLFVQHDSVMLEACNASFQIHFQVEPDEFAELYNVALAVAGPVLAAAANSPVMLGKRLWHETRIAVFQQSVDTRTGLPEMREIPPRVSFGRQWVDSSVLDIIREDIARFKVILGRDVEEDPFEAMAESRAPSLQAFQLFNSTVYRWNRPCYGAVDGLAHLRIENRVLPSGPTVVDEIANAAFWFGLISGLSHEYSDIRQHLDFADVRTNFVAAARNGLDAQMTWTGGITYTTQELICELLLPLARKGLTDVNIDSSDIDKYLGIIRDRVTSRQTGAQWMIRSLAAMQGKGTAEERAAALVAATVERQTTSQPVHTWDLAHFDESSDWRPSFIRVEQYMTTDLLTVTESEPIDLVAKMMDWNRIHHVPVEDAQHNLVGLVSHRPLLRFLASDDYANREGPVAVSEVMVRDLVTIGSDTKTVEAIELMRENQISCLPVTRDGQLIGIVTDRDFMRIARQLLEEKLRE